MISPLKLYYFTFCCLFTTSVYAQIPTQGLIGHYPLDGNAFDQTPPARHGMPVFTAASADRFGSPGKALYFNGNNAHVEIPHTFDLFPRSIHFWFYAAPGDYSEWKTIFSLDNPGLECGLAVAMLREVDNRLSLQLSLADVWKSFDVVPGMWFHVSMCASADRTIQFRINGQLRHTEILSNFLTSVNGKNSVILGAGREASNRFFHGSMDELLIYNRCLADYEIDSIIQRGSFFAPLRIYPNPCPGQLRVDCGGQFTRLENQTFYVTNLLGQQLLRQPVQQPRFEIDLMALAGKGMYLVFFRDADGRVSDLQKIVVP